MITILPGCAVIADLGQFDGYVQANVGEGGAGFDAELIDVAAERSAVDVIDAQQAGDEAGGPPADACYANGWPEGGTNLLTDPALTSVGTSGAPLDGGPAWNALYGGTASISSTIRFCGMNVAQLTNRTNFYNALATNVSTMPGNYIASAWVMQTAAVPAGLALGGLCQLADGGSMYPGGSPQTVQPNTWTFLSLVLTVPTGCASMQFFVTQQNMAQPPYPDIFVATPYYGH